MTGNEYLVKDAKSVLAVTADNTWYVISAEENVMFLNNEGNYIYYTMMQFTANFVQDVYLSSPDENGQRTKAEGWTRG